MTLNLPIAFIGFVFGIVETWHFGWNLTPQSDAETVCDGITFLIYALAFLKPS